MSAKQTIEDATSNTEEICKQLNDAKISETGVSDGDTTSNKSKKKNKKKKANNIENKTETTANGEHVENDQETGSPTENVTAKEEINEENQGATEEAKKKRKRNRNKNKKKADDSIASNVQQTDPPSLPVSQLFPDGNFPEGQVMDHHIANDDKKAADRFSSEEARAIDRAQLDMYNEIRQAAEAHRQTRQYIQKWVKPGMKMIDICNELESTARKLINENGLQVIQIDNNGLIRGSNYISHCIWMAHAIMRFYVSGRSSISDRMLYQPLCRTLHTKRRRPNSSWGR